ncbi:MAG TPA: YCF48-related protein [Myxococcota bacterium]|nr:YCF48-related protein [Myxococcota bacterium]HRY96228.1 YCF48-related protein [Myxococcota bacterium]
MRRSPWGLALALLLSASALRAGPLEEISHRDKLYDLALRGDEAFAVGYPGLLLASADRGRTWRALDAGTRDVLYAIALNGAGQGIIVGRAGLVLTSADAGRSWQRRESGVTSSLFDVALTDDGQAWAVGHLGVILHSADAGASWQAQAYDATLPPLAGAQAEPGAVEALSSAEEDNEGAVEEARLLAVAFADGLRGWIVGEFGLILRTEDGGKRWVRQRAASGNLLFGLHVVDALRALAFGAEGVAMRTADGGLTWTLVPVGTQDHLLAAGPAGARVFLAGRDGLLLSIDEDGAQPALHPTGTYVWLNAIRFFDASVGLAAGGRGHLLRTVDGGETWQRLAGR